MLSNFIKKSTAVIVIVTVLGAYFWQAPQAKADAGGDLAQCMAAGLIRSVISYGVGLVLNAILGEVPVNDSQNNAKEFILDLTARCLARVAFDSTVSGMLQIVRGGSRDNGADYIRNWRNFMTNTEYRGEAVFRSVLANTELCSYLSNDVRRAFRVTTADKVSLQGQNIRTGDLDPYTLRARCSLPPNFDPQKFQSDFAGNGGWDTVRKLLEPQNNIYGAILQAADESARQKQLESASDINDVQTGRGYLSLRNCSVREQNGRCRIYDVIRTPGSYVADTVAATIQNELGWITSVHELNELVVNGITQRLTSRLFDLGASESTPVYGPDPTPPPGIIPAPAPVSTGGVGGECPVFGSARCPGECGGPSNGSNAYLLRVGHQEQDPVSKKLYDVGTGDPNDYTTWSWSREPRTEKEWCDPNTEVPVTGPPPQRPTFPATIRCIDGSSGGIDYSKYPLCGSQNAGGGSGSGGGGGPSPTPGTGGTGTCPIVPGQSNRYQSEVRAAIVQLANTTSGILTPDNGDTFKITGDLTAYRNGVMSILRSQGFTVNFTDGRELNIFRAGDTTSQQYLIDTSNLLTGYKHAAEGCPLP